MKVYMSEIKVCFGSMRVVYIILSILMTIAIAWIELGYNLGITTDLIWIIHLFQDTISLPWGLHNLNKERVLKNGKNY